MASIEISGETSTASNAPQVHVLNSQREQAEAVIGTLLEGIAQTSRVQGQTGQRINVTA